MNTSESTTLERDGFTVTVTANYEDWPDLSYIGEYKDQPYDDERLSVDVWAHEHNWRPGDSDIVGVHRWFNPFYGGDGERLGDRHKMAVEWGKHFATNKLHEGYRAVMAARMQDYKRMCAFNAGDWCQLFVTATASREGVELGHDTIGGIESDVYESLLDVCSEHGLIEEALEDARAKLRALTA